MIEYHRKDSVRLVEQISQIVKPGGILCLIDLDYNCMSHWGVPRRLEKTLFELMAVLEQNADFDPYAGRKLYSYLYQLGYNEICVSVQAHHLIYGNLKAWMPITGQKRSRRLAKRYNFLSQTMKGDTRNFSVNSCSFSLIPGRFSYTPIISVRGQKPL